MKTPNRKDDYLSRKFVLTVAVLAVGSIALLIGKMGGGEFVALATLVLGVYGTANVTEKKKYALAAGD